MILRVPARGQVARVSKTTPGPDTPTNESEHTTHHALGLTHASIYTGTALGGLTVRSLYV